MTREQALADGADLAVWLRQRGWGRSAEVVETLVSVADYDLPPIENPPVRASGSDRDKQNRLKSEVEKLRSSGPASGCCDRFFDNQGCDCLSQARCDVCKGSGRSHGGFGTNICPVCGGAGR